MERTLPERADELPVIHLRHPEIQQNGIEALSRSIENRQGLPAIRRFLYLVIS